MRIGRILAVLAMLLPTAALAQSNPNWSTGYVPPASEWNNLWSGKLDLGGNASNTTTTAPGGVARSLSSRTQDRLNVRDFGAIGDGLTHPLSTTYANLAAAQAICPEATTLSQETDWCAFQAAFDKAAAKTYGAIVYAPASRYLISTPVTATLTGAQAIMLMGDGLTATEILQTRSTVDGFDITLGASGTWLRDSGGSGPAFQQQGFSVVKSSGGVGNNAVSVSSTFAGTALRQVSTHDVEYRGDKFAGAWANGLSMVGIQMPDIGDVHCHAASGSGDTSSVCIYFAGYSSANEVIDANFDNVRMVGGGAAIVVGPNVQGVYARRIYATGSQHGVVWNSGNSGSPDSLIVSSSQLNTVVDAVYADYVADVQVSDTLMFPQFGTYSTTTAAAINVGDTTLSVVSAISLGIGQGVTNASFPTGTLVTAVSGMTITVSQAATVASASGVAAAFYRSPGWIGVRVGNRNRFTINGDIFNLGGIASQIAVSAVNMNGGSISGNHAYLVSNPSGPFQLTGTTASVIVDSNSCVTCSVVGYDSNAGATGNYASNNILNFGLVLSGFGSTTAAFSFGNASIVHGGGGTIFLQNSRGYPFIMQDDGSTPTARIRVQGSSTGTPNYSCDAVNGGGVVGTPNNCSVQLLGSGTGSALLGSTTIPTQVLGTMIVAQHTPASSTEACTAGQTADDATYHYWCATAGQWLRVAGATW